jgi:hypothetical protein
LIPLNKNKKIKKAIEASSNPPPRPVRTIIKIDKKIHLNDKMSEINLFTFNSIN